ncbi:hypothetical protein J2T13_000464 [Paenibacillus sp. DS2015]|uniref:hypothetical protein n=1 Tax=Paenibacillus sp. DS2015 TaxID=3373917 RepID=UPI003D19C163
MAEGLVYSNASLIFHTALDEEMKFMISKHFNKSWMQLQRSVRLTALSFEYKFTQYLFPMEVDSEPLIMRIPHIHHHFFYADFGIVKDDIQTYVTIYRSNILQVFDDNKVDSFDSYSFLKNRSSIPLIEQNRWWEYFNGYSLSDK